MDLWGLDSAFLFAVAQIIMIDILLGGDNAVVIALACRRLPEAQRSKGIFWGVVGAIAVRIVLIFFALQLLSLPYLKLVGAALLLWIGGQGVAGFIAACVLLLSAHTVHAFEMYAEEMEDL